MLTIDQVLNLKRGDKLIYNNNMKKEKETVYFYEIGKGEGSLRILFLKYGVMNNSEYDNLISLLAATTDELEICQ